MTPYEELQSLDTGEILDRESNTEFQVRRHLARTVAVHLLLPEDMKDLRLACAQATRICRMNGIRHPKGGEEPFLEYQRLLDDITSKINTDKEFQKVLIEEYQSLPMERRSDMNDSEARDLVEHIEVLFDVPA